MILILYCSFWVTMETGARQPSDLVRGCNRADGIFVSLYGRLFIAGIVATPHLMSSLLLSKLFPSSRFLTWFWNSCFWSPVRPFAFSAWTDIPSRSSMFLTFSFRGNPNISATNRKLAAYENDQYQFSKQTSKNKWFEWSAYLMQSLTRIFTERL